MSAVLFEFFFHLGLVLLDQCSPSDIVPSELLILKIRNILQYYSLKPSDKAIIFSSSNLMEAIISAYQSKEALVNTISSSIMSIKLQEDQTLGHFLSTLPDNSPLKKRILELLNEDCPICFESYAQNSDDVSAGGLVPHVFQCGHGTCSNCVPRIEKCPICREDIGLSMPRSFPVNICANIASDSSSSTSAPSVSKKPLSIIADTSAFLKERLAKMLSKAEGKFTPLQQEELFLIAKYFPEIILEVCLGLSIRSENARCFLPAIMYKLHDNRTLFTKINTPDRVLRFLNALFVDSAKNSINSVQVEYGDADQKGKILLNGGGKKFKQDILSLINSIPDTLDNRSQFAKMRNKWKAVFSFVHPFEKRNRETFPTAFQLANSFFNYRFAEKINSVKWVSVVKNNKIKKPHPKFVLYNAPEIRKMITVLGMVNKLIMNRDLSVLEILLDNPGLTYRIMRRLAIAFQSCPEFSIFLEKIIPKMTFDQQCNLYHVFSGCTVIKSDEGANDFKPDLQTVNVVVTSKATMKW